jgi:hypothetical protein
MTELLINFIQERRFSFLYHKNKLPNKFFTSSLIRFCSSGDRDIPFKCWHNSICVKSLKMFSPTNNQFFFFNKIHFFSYLLTLKWYKPSEFYASKVISFKPFPIYTETFELTSIVRTYSNLHILFSLNWFSHHLRLFQFPIGYK